MAEPAKNPLSSEPDRLVKGVLAKLGDVVDSFTGRRWQPSSSLATSELIERVKRLLDSEARDVPGKGKVVPHRITLKMQWDKFATDNDDALAALQDELLIATVDHINDSLYYTNAPVNVLVRPDYFTEGVRLSASFDDADSTDEADAELNVTVPDAKLSSIVIDDTASEAPPAELAQRRLTAAFTIGSDERQVTVEFPSDRRISVGRTRESRLQIDDSSISKHHAVIAIANDGSLTIADTGSTNGTYLNGERIAYGKAVSIGDDDTLAFGTVEVKIKVEPAVEVEAAADSTE